MASYAPGRDSGGVTASEGADKRPGKAHVEAHGEGDGSQSAEISTRLNWLRAGVLGANDGIISTAGLVVGMAGATTSRSAILAAGVAGLLAGSLSMAAGSTSPSVPSGTPNGRHSTWNAGNWPKSRRRSSTNSPTCSPSGGSAGTWRGRPPSS